MEINARNKLKAKSLRIIFFLSVLLCMAPLYAQEVPATEEPQQKEQERFLVDFDFRDADIRDVARAFSRISKTNIIVSDDVKANVTMKVQTMDWKEALTMILGAYNITLMEKDSYIIITTAERRKQAEESGELQTRVVSLNFVNVVDTQKTLLSMLSSRGRIEIDARTNSLVITDIPEKADKIHNVALELDTKTPQVMIEALIVTVKLNDDEQFGIDWLLKPVETNEWSFRQDLSLGRSTGFQAGWAKTVLPTWADLSTLIEYWKEQKRVNILASPRVMTLDNFTATIDLTEQVPYTSQSQSTSGSGETVQSTQFKDIPISLYVKPHITKDNYIFMNIKTEQSIHSGDTSDFQPIVDSRKAETNVMVRDGETVVIGGLRKKEHTTTVDKLPFISDIPYVGNLFKKTITAEVDTELLIFVTPRIVTEAMMTEHEKAQLAASSVLKEYDEKGLNEKGKSLKQNRVKEIPKPQEQIKTAGDVPGLFGQGVPFPLRPPSELK